jgi:hypothetical protein
VKELQSLPDMTEKDFLQQSNLKAKTSKEMNSSQDIMTIAAIISII